MRDPRRYPYGYLAGDPGTGAMASPVWFAGPGELLEFLVTTEVALLQFDADESARIRASLERAIGGARDLARIDRHALSAAFEGWCEVLWLGTFADLRTRGGSMHTTVRAAFRADYRLGEHAGPIADDELESFVAWLASEAEATEDIAV